MLLQNLVDRCFELVHFGVYALILVDNLVGVILSGSFLVFNFLQDLVAFSVHVVLELDPRLLVWCSIVPGSD